MTLKTNVMGKHLNFLDPFLTALFNYNDLREKSEIKTIIDKVVTSPHRYVILLPKIEPIFSINGAESKPPGNLDFDSFFFRSHIVDTETGHSIGNETSVSTMHGGLSLFRNGYFLRKEGDLESGKNTIYIESLIYSTVSYLYPGYKLQVCFIESPLVYAGGNRVSQDLLSGFKKSIEGQYENSEDDYREDFNHLMNNLPELANNIGPQFRSLFLNFDVRQARSEGELMSLFLATVIEAVEIVRSLPTPAHLVLIKKFNEEGLRQAVYEYVEMNVYDKLWQRFVDLCTTHTDRLLNASYEVFQHMSISQLGLPDSVLENTSLIQLLLGRVAKAVSEIRMLDYLMTASKKLDVLSKAIHALSHNPSKSNCEFIMDADTLLSLVILVLGTAGVTNIQCQVKYIKRYYIFPEKFQSGSLGYVISTIEAALSYLSDDKNIKLLSRQCRVNEKLWNTICLPVEDPFWTAIPENLHSLQDHLHKVVGFEMAHSFAGRAFRSRNLKGESCLTIAIKRRSWPVFKTLVDLREIYDLDFILTDTDNTGSTLLQLALIEGDSKIILELVDIISEATESEIELYCSKLNNLGRNLGHYLMNYEPLVQMLGTYINWRQVDCFHQTPLATIVRCYDHPNYPDLLEAVLHTVCEWYAKHNLSFDLKDHLDAKNNSLLHSFKDGRTLGFFLKLFCGLDPNYPNSQCLTPLMFSIKYNKFWNVYDLLSDENTDISSANSKNHLMAFDYIKTSMLQHSLQQESESLSDSDRLRFKILTTMSNSLLRTFCPKNSIRSAVIITKRYSTDSDAFLYLFLMSGNKPSSQNVGSITRHKESELIKMLTALKLSRPYDFPQVRLSFLRKLRMGSNQHHSFGHMSRLLENDRTSQLNLLLASLTMNEERGIDGELWKLLSKKTSLDSSDHSQQLIPFKQEFSYDSICEELISAQTFVQLTCNDLLKFLETCEKLYRQHSLCGILWSDIEKLYSWVSDGMRFSEEPDHISHGYTGIRGLFNTSATILSMSKNANGEKLLDSLSFFLYSAKDLRDELRYFSDLYIEKTWSLFDRISGLQDQCHQLLQTAQQHSSLTRISYDQLSQLAARISEYLVRSRYSYLKSTGNISTTNLPHQQSSIFAIFDLSRFSERNRITQARKLEELFTAITGDINRLAIRFRAGYESISMELNNFYLFKKRFFPIVFRQFAKTQIKMLKSQHNRLKLDRERFLLNKPT
ncbi:hypothetical protein KL906_002128 [Ogataea polymorpha]|nr:hypothetical protein KL906_002128 [Ogataea polymorpha]KAG7916892.1 hypothetical protein KL927_002666 [Ogataea polymorpha]